MGHYLHDYLVGQSILNALVAWRQILSYKLCVVLLHEEETLECYVVTMVLILWEHKRNWKKHTKKWIIKRLNSSFRTLVRITSIGTGTCQHQTIWGCLEKTNVFIVHTRKISER